MNREESSPIRPPVSEENNALCRASFRGRPGSAALPGLLVKGQGILVMLLLIMLPLQAQEIKPDPAPGLYREGLLLQTDRKIYFSGEEVWLNITKVNAVTHLPDNVSKVVYIELLNRSGYPVAQVKLPVSGTSASTRILLADTLSTGNYLIRAYTNWMKNFGEECFAFREITLVNAFQYPGEILSSRPPEQGAVKEDTTGLTPTGNSPGPAAKDNGSPLVVHLTLTQPSYGLREKVEANLLVTDADNHPVPAEVTVSVAKTGLCDTGPSSQLLRNGDLPGPDPARITYPPELEGKIIHGTLRDYDDNTPLGEKDLVFSVVGKKAKCQFYQTQKTGDFYFYLRETGMKNLVIQPLNKIKENYDISLQPDFLTSVTHLPHAFHLDTSLLDILNNAIISYQLHKIYQPFVAAAPTDTDYRRSYSFYGDPINTIRLADYIPLSSVGEIIKEIVPDVSVHKRGGEYYFQLISEKYRDILDENPLILVDGTPYRDISQILKMPPSSLERIEVINLRFLIGNHTFSGVIHFISKSGLLDHVSMDPLVFRQSYLCLQEKETFSAPTYEKGDTLHTRIPDYRNTLYWNPELHTGSDGRSGITFFTSDEPGSYTIGIEAISTDGRTGVLRKTIHVKTTHPLSVNRHP